MSVPTNSLTIKEWWVYAEHLAANHTDINHVPDTYVAFTRAQFPELQGADFQNLQSPCLIAEAPESSGIDNHSNNLLAQRFLAWTIAKRVDVQTGTYAERIDAEVACETIAVEVLARLRAERIHRGGQVFADVKMDAWEGDVMSPFLPAGWVGYRIMVPIQVSDRRLKHDPANWTDTIGTVLLSDLTGISCANLNHPTLGLTLSQRLNCILPGYDFANAATLNALTDQQETDLIAAFGGGGGSTFCELMDTQDAAEGVGCIPNNNFTNWLAEIIDDARATPDLGVEAIANAGLTEQYQAILCSAPPVTILDQDDNEIASVPAGGTYHVVVLDGINDAAPYVGVITINDI